MERLRLWIQTLALLGLAVAALASTFGLVVPSARAAEAPVCTSVRASLLASTMVEEVHDALVAFGAREHVVVVPFGANNSAVLCAW